MLEKKTVFNSIEIAENGCVQVCVKTEILEDGKQISGTLHRHIVAPGDDYSQENERVKAVCAAVHTPEVIEAYQASFINQP